MKALPPTNAPSAMNIIIIITKSLKNERLLRNSKINKILGSSDIWTI